MTRIIRAELLRLVRRRTLLIGVGAAVLFAVVAAFAVFSSATASGTPSNPRGTTVAALAGTGGGTEAFAVGASFLGFFVFVTFIALLAGEFSGGTLRALLLRDPHRVRVIVGKLVGILLVAGAIVALAELCTFATSLLVAPSKDVATSNWFSLASMGAGARDYMTVMAGVAGWAVFGTTLAVIFRSAPLALGVGFVWAGPFENIISRSWTTGYRVFPGQVLGALIEGGSAELAVGRAVVTALAYTAVAATVTVVLLTRRDVTA